MIVGFTGTQVGMNDIQQANVVMWLTANNYRIASARHGDCIGADAAFHDMCLLREIDIIVHPPIDPKKRAFCKGYSVIYPPKDYITRNHDIVDGSDILLATPQYDRETLRSGTWATIRYAKRMKRSHTIFYPDGTWEDL